MKLWPGRFGRPKQGGFTLVELMITLVISSVMLMVIINFFSSQRQSYAVQEQVAEMQQNIRAAMDIMVREVREAGFQEPNGTLTVGITSALAGSITFSTDLDSDGLPESSRFDLNNMTVRHNTEPIAENILAIGFAYAYDEDEDKTIEEDAAGNFIWAYDSDGDNDLDRQIDGTGLPGNDVGYEKIRAVQMWVLARPARADNNFYDGLTYQVGSQTITPNDKHRHRLLSSTVKLRNMGLKD